MVFVIVFGIGVLMIMLMVFYVLFGDLILYKSDCLFLVQVDLWMMLGYQFGEEFEDQMMCFDVEVLLCECQVKYQVVMIGGGVMIELDKVVLCFFDIDVCYIFNDFFVMFDMFFLYGCVWLVNEDEGCGCVVVIFCMFNQKLFDGVDSIGRIICMDVMVFIVVGVFDEWNLNLYFYDLEIGWYGGSEDVYLLFFMVMDFKFGCNGNMNCWGNFNGDEIGINVLCMWLQYWVELFLVGDVDDYWVYLNNYFVQQKVVGCFQCLLNVCLCNVMEWLDYKQVVFSDVWLQFWFVMGFLLVCLINIVGLLLVKFLCCSGEIGVCCVLGVSCVQIFLQLLVEVGMVGLVGGVFGFGLVVFGLYVVCQQLVEYVKLVMLDGQMLLLIFVLILVVSLLVGFLFVLCVMQVVFVI